MKNYQIKENKKKENYGGMVQNYLLKNNTTILMIIMKI